MLRSKYTMIRVTPSTYPQEGPETAVRCCDPALSVLVMLVSQTVFHVVSALQSTVFVQAALTQVARVWFLMGIRGHTHIQRRRRG